jgi:hypothetical protein
MNPTNPNHTAASVPPMEASLSRDTQVLVWVAGLLFCATTWSLVATAFLYWLR